MSDAIREAFEAWWRGWSNIASTRQGEGYAEVAESVAWATWQAALQSQTAPAVPEGWKLVPVEPTDEQVAAGWRNQHPENIYKNMLTAAPQPDHSPDAGKALPVAIPDRDFDETDPIHQAADAYSHACEIMEQYQTERVEAGKEPGAAGSLCDGIAWLYQRIQELENHSPDAGKVVRGELVGYVSQRFIEAEFLDMGKISRTRGPERVGTGGAKFEVPVYTHPAESREEIHRLGQQLYEAARCLGCAQAGGNPDAAEHWSSKAEAILARLRASQQEGGEG